MGDAPRRVQGELAREVETRRVSRRERAREIALLREREGLSFAEIAERLELATSTVRDYHRDPDAERNRRIASAIGANANSAGARRPATAATTPRASALGAHARGRECGAPIGSSRPSGSGATSPVGRRPCPTGRRLTPTKGIQAPPAS